MSSFAYWAKSELPDIRLTGPTTQEKKDQRSAGSAKLTHRNRKLSAQLNNSVTMDVDVDNDLQCPICLELYTYPIILPCSHVLCRTPCAEHLFDFNFIRCPVCRDNCYVSGGISSLPRVIALENIIERYKNEQKKGKSSPRPSSSASNLSNRSTEAIKESPVSSSSTSSNLSKSLALLNNSVSSLSSLTAEIKEETDIKCQNCRSSNRKRAKKHCVTCNRSYCGTCLRVTHPNKEPFTSHEFTEPGLARARSNHTTTNTFTNNDLPNVADAYCQLCTQPFCSRTEDATIHIGHSVTPIDDAYRDLKNVIEENSEKLSHGQSKLVTVLKDLKDGLKDLQLEMSRKKDQINMQCDALLAEIENKRSYFLADLDYEERIHQTNFEESIKTLETILGSSKGLQSYVNDVMASDRPQFLEVANTLNERIVKATVDCDGSSYSFPLDMESINNKVLDCRKEKAILRDLHYLSAPSTPIVDVSRCSRSENAVVLALCPPSGVHELVDQYEIHFCSEEQKNIELEETIIVKNSVEETGSAKLSSNSSGILVLLIENLCRSTTYYFCMSACNSAGKSGSSEVVQCTTLSEEENVIPVPAIHEALCKKFTSSIQIFSSSPMDVAVEQKISHFLLYRQPSHNRAWRCVSMYGREEHRVFGLEPATEYEFVILAYNLRGECQLSNKVTIETDSASSF